ncbi:hypothetical protein [Celeribacter litoreus]|uniref:hypothetical protein n=1 Tax=Celeribacter litoreus TaxID=2876714 RepID=UPI001CCA9740|nr:hypothetical protein [Celeribacter litoreus]MCA0045112.1 hypothetical protein [Celeribacter litoreus]
MTTKIENTEINIQIATKAVTDLKKLRKQFASADQLLSRANKAVYAVLSSAFDVLVALKTAEEPKRVLQTFEQQLEAMTRDKKAKHAIASTSLELKVIRFVCGELKQKRESTYARVLRVAFAEEIHNKDYCFKDWIVAAGGVDEVRRSGNGEPRKDYAAIARDAFKSIAPLAPVAAAHIKRAAEKEVADTEFCVAILRKNADGSFGIISTVDNAALTKQALARAGKGLADAEELASAAEKQREQERAASEATQQLASSSTTEQKEAA